MRILFDQATPIPLRAFLMGRKVRTAAQGGWDTLQNGDLLSLAEQSGFDVLLTTNKNMKHQQNLSGRRITIIVLGPSHWPRLRSFVQSVVDAVNAATPGSYAEVSMPS